MYYEDRWGERLKIGLGEGSDAQDERFGHGPGQTGGRRSAVGRILGGLQNSDLEKKERGGERERGMHNASLTRTWAHARPVRIASRIPPGQVAACRANRWYGVVPRGSAWGASV